MADPLGPPIWAPFNVVICFAKITSVLDIIKLVAAFAGGGLAGALANEYFRRRSNRLQPIPLIERVNRPLGPGHRGFTLARVVEVAGQDARLEPIRNLREYQLTLRNTSTIHLQNVEIQFEFPSEDVDAYASRPARSNTAPVVVDAAVTPPWKVGFRWRIPHLPSTDSIEFAFRAVNPTSPKYAVALFGTDRVVVERVEGEPPADKRDGVSRLLRSGLIIATIGVVASLFSAALAVWSGAHNKVSNVHNADCSFTLTASYNQFMLMS